MVAPFGGIDAMLQLGLLEWTARHWTDPDTWLNLPIFHPVPGALGFMDSLLGQAWLVFPIRWLLNPTAAGLYNWAFLGSLITAAAASVLFWRFSGGRWMTAGAFALALVGCYQGYSVRGGAHEVGFAVNRAVVWGIGLILMLNYIVTALCF